MQSKRRKSFLKKQRKWRYIFLFHSYQLRYIANGREEKRSKERTNKSFNEASESKCCQGSICWMVTFPLVWKKLIHRYVGSMDRITAETILSNCGYNSFLIRIGSVPGTNRNIIQLLGCFVISKYNILTKSYYHVLVANKNGAYYIQDSVDVTPYTSLAELVDRSPEIGNYKY